MGKNMPFRQASPASLAAVLALCFGFVAVTLTSSGFARGHELYVGVWMDKQNTGLKMSISEDNGLLRITGGFGEDYHYRLSCVVKSGKAACQGSGGKLEGENFLYESFITFSQNGAAAEDWKAYNNLQAINGKTNWVRKR